MFLVLLYRYRSTFSTGGTYRPSSYSSTGGYGDRYDDDRYDGRYGSRDEDRNGYGREREWGYRDDDRYGRSGDPYSREGERYGRDFDDRYGKESYRDDDFRGSRSNDDYQYGSRNKSFDRDRDRSFDDDDHYSSRYGLISALINMLVYFANKKLFFVINPHDSISL